MDDKRALLHEIQERALEMPASLEAVADFLLMEGSGVETMSMAELARATYTSKPTLVRFAKQLGYSGWPEFRIAFVREARLVETAAEKLSGVNVNYPFGPESTCSEAALSSMRVRELAARHVADRLDDSLLAAAAEAIDAADITVFLGRPPSSYYGAAFAFKLTSIGMRCWVPHVEEAEYGQRMAGEGNRVAIFSSYSGMLSKEPFTLIEPMRAQGLTILAVTSDGSPLEKVADIAFTYAPIERYYDKVTGTYSCACTELWLDAIFSSLYLRHYDENASARSRHIKQFESATNIHDNFGTER